MSSAASGARRPASLKSLARSSGTVTVRVESDSHDVSTLRGRGELPSYRRLTGWLPPDGAPTGSVPTDVSSSKQAFERIALRQVLLGIGPLESFEIDQFPANGRQLGGLG